MKKILVVGLVVAAALKVQAAKHIVSSFMPNCIGVNVTNNGSIVYGTGICQYTNLSGQRLTGQTPPFQDVDLPEPLFAQGPVYAGTTTSDYILTGSTTGESNKVTKAEIQTTYPISQACIMVRMKGAGARTGAVTFTFKPVPDGVNVETVTTFDFTLAPASNGTTFVTAYGFVPMYKLQGVKKLRLHSIAVANDTNDVVVWDVKLCSWVP